MPSPGSAWWHVMWNTYGTWLPGDPRGFRNRLHRIHSSGDYKTPPPSGEHAGLHRYNIEQMNGEVVLRSSAERTRVCHALAQVLTDMNCRPMIVAVGRTHVHLLAEMPVELEKFDTALARIKTRSSRAILSKVNGRGWGRGRKSVLVSTLQQRRTTFNYILNH